MDIPENGADRAKYACAEKALEYIEDGMTVGLGTGSTAAYLVALLGERVANGLQIVGVPTSSRTKEQAEGLNIPLTTLDKAGWLDLVIDGADEFDPALNLVKGGGGALLQEKLVATASDKMIVISDSSKEVEHLGAFPLPIEVVRFGWQSTERKIAALLQDADVTGHEIMRRMAGDSPYNTDEGHYILDLKLQRIGNPEKLAHDIKLIVGVVETGLFVNIAKMVILGHADGTTRIIEG